MAKQTFTTGQVLTAAQMTSLQQTAMLGGAASAKTASYTLVAADAGTAVSMSNASATTITVNTALFAAGDTVQITNLGAGVCTITAGTATVNTSSSLALAQYESGTLDFTSTSAAIFIKGDVASGGGGGTYTAYTPTFQDITLGNGTLTARYCQIGKFVEIQIEIVFGSTTSIGGGNTRITLPVTAKTGDYGIRGMAKYGDANGNEYLGMLDQRSTTEMAPRFCAVDSAKVINYGISSTSPFTWTTNDQITLFYVYEAA